MNTAVKVKTEKEFDTVMFFRKVKEKIAIVTEGMTLQEKRKWFQKIREDEIPQLL
jgi:predicted CoA-binding protein